MKYRTDKPFMSERTTGIGWSYNRKYQAAIGQLGGLGCWEVKRQQRQTSLPYCLPEDSPRYGNKPEATR